MKVMYAILSIAGWVWLAIAVPLLWWRVSLIRRQEPRRRAEPGEPAERV